MLVYGGVVPVWRIGECSSRATLCVYMVRFALLLWPYVSWMFICYVATCSDGQQSACMDTTNLEATLEIATTSKCGRRANEQAKKRRAGEYYT